MGLEEVRQARDGGERPAKGLPLPGNDSAAEQPYPVAVVAIGRWLLG